MGPDVLRHRGFALYWTGVVLSEIGTRGTAAAVLYHVYLLSGSSLQVGFVGLAQVIALLVLSPVGGAIADRMDRRRLLQTAQSLSLLASLFLAAVTLAGAVEVWHIIAAVLFNTSAAAFERPARDALIPALVPAGALVKAFSLVNPSREFAILLGPAIAGALMAFGGPEAMYLLDVFSYVVIIAVLFLVSVPPVPADRVRPNMWASIGEGIHHFRRQPLILQLVGLDLAATVFGAYRVLLPAFAADILGIGAFGYGVLSSLPSAGALLGAVIIYRIAERVRPGHVVLWATAGYGAACLGLAGSGRLSAVSAVMAACLAAAALGLFDSLATTVRHAAVQIETPDEIRGRITALYQMASRGGPSLGRLNIGWLASLFGPIGALALGGLVPIAAAGWVAVKGGRVREYRGTSPAAR